MNYKAEGALRRNKKYFIIFGILWLFIAIVLIVPITVAWNAVVTEGATVAISKFVETMKNPFVGLGEIVSLNLMGTYFKNIVIFTILYAIFFRR